MIRTNALLCLVLLAPGCVPTEPAPVTSAESPPAVTSQAPRQARASLVTRRHTPERIMRPVTDHVSDSLEDAFPALPPPVVADFLQRDPARQPIARATLPDIAERGGDELSPRQAAPLLLTDAGLE